MSDVVSNMNVLSKHAERVNKAKDDLSNEEKGLILEKEEIRRQGVKDISLVRDRARREVELANQAGEHEKQLMAQLNQTNVAVLNENNRKRMENLAAQTAKEVAALELRAQKDIHDFNSANVEKLLDSSTRAEDPFYRAKQFTTEIGETDDHYDVKIKLPPHEARDVMVSGFSNQLKISFARHYEADTPISPTQSNTTRSHESVTESYILPTNINFKNVVKNYADGVLSIKIAKANPVKFTTIEDSKRDLTVAATDRKNAGSSAEPLTPTTSGPKTS